MRFHCVRLVSTFIAATAAVCAQAWAADPAASYPSKPVRLIVPFAPGGTNDILARMYATHFSETQPYSMIVDNRPGAAGIIGTEITANATPDGYTILMVSSAYGMNPIVHKLPYDPLKAVDFIGRIGQSFLILSVNPNSPVKSVSDLLALAQKRPGEITLSTSGGFQHFATALFKSVAKRNFNIIIYKGGFPAMMDVMGGQIDANLAVSLPALPHLKSGKLRGLAVGLPKRSELLPNLPTMEEAGVKGYDAANWYALAVTAGTPRPIVMKLHEIMVKFFTSPEMVRKLTNMGGVVDIKTPEEMRKYIPEEIAKWTKVAIDANMPRVKK